MLKAKQRESCQNIYNEDIKAMFLDEQMESGTISEETADNYLRIFASISEIEEKLNKDVREFDHDEIDKLLYSFNSRTRNTIESYGRIISKYLNWNVEKGYIETNILKEFKPVSFEKYIRDDEVYLTEQKLRDIEDECKNAQDAIILRLLFIGLGGKQMSELRNLRKEDVDYSRKSLELRSTITADSNGVPLKVDPRTHKFIDDRTLDMLKEAIEQTEYEKRNGAMDFRENINPYTELINNDYVIRPSKTQTTNYNYPADKFVIYRRIQTISEYFNIKDLTAKFIQRSGMLYYANSLIENEQFTQEDLKLVASRFGVKSYHNLKGFLTYENIRKAYPIKGEENAGETIQKSYHS